MANDHNIGGLFTDVRTYAFPNSGGRYDFGCLLGAAMFLGGCGAGMEKRVPSGDRRLHSAGSAVGRRAFWYLEAAPHLEYI
jgi:hypothetical protein